MMATYASATKTPWKKSRDEIESTLSRYGASRFAYGVTEDAAHVAFFADERQIRFTLPLPDRNSTEFTRTPTTRQLRSADAQEAAFDQAIRQRWRALLLIVKAKLEAVEAGIVTFEQEFLAHTVLPNGHTVFEETAPAIERAYVEGHVRPLLELGS